METPADHRMMDAPDTFGKQARTDCHDRDRHDGDREDDDQGDRDEDEETGMDDGCLDADTSGVECEHMSMSGDHTTAAPGNGMEDASTTVGNPQDGSMGANNFFRIDHNNPSKHRDTVKRNSIFDLERTPSHPGQKEFVQSPHCC
jgi:hypothetical protein